MNGAMGRRWSTDLRERAKAQNLGILFVVCRDSKGYEMATERPLSQEQCEAVWKFVTELGTVELGKKPEEKEE